MKSQVPYVPPMEELERLKYLYAQFIIQKALAVCSGQRVHLLRAPRDAQSFVQLLTQLATEAGAQEVSIHWENEEDRLEALDSHSFSKIITAQNWIADLAARPLTKDAFIIFDCVCSGIFDHSDEKSVLDLIYVENQGMAPLWRQLSINAAKWTMITVPTDHWARRRYPKVDLREGKLLLWKDIFARCRISLSDPVFQQWERHIHYLEGKAAQLNNIRFSRLRLLSAGTDITVALAQGHRWRGPVFVTPGGEHFIPNIPMNEIFTAPHRSDVTGIVRSVRPVVVNGIEIDGIELVFSAGRVISARAEKGDGPLQLILKSDEGSSRLGEIALVPRATTVTTSAIPIFYSTLFDENAGSHLALGRAYRVSIEPILEDQEFLAAGGNLSNIHIDFTVDDGSLTVEGFSKNGEKDLIFYNGKWVLP